MVQTKKPTDIEDELDSLKIQFYAVSSVLAFLVIVTIAVIIDLSVKVRKLRKGEQDDEEDDEPMQRPPPPKVNSGFSLPKPNIAKNWADDDTELRRQNDQREFNIPKPALSKSWQAYPGERDRKRNQENDYRHEDDNFSFDGNKSSGGAFRNPLSGDSERSYDNRPRQPQFKLPSTSGNNFSQGGNDNYGYRRDQRNNNYY